MNQEFDGNDALDRYFDGALSPEEQRALFSAMGTDPDLLRDFQALDSIRKLLRSDVVTPPAALKTATLQTISELTAPFGTAASGLFLSRMWFLGGLMALIGSMMTIYFVVDDLNAGSRAIPGRESAAAETMSPFPPNDGAQTTELPIVASALRGEPSLDRSPVPSPGKPESLVADTGNAAREYVDLLPVPSTLLVQPLYPKLLLESASAQMPLTAHNLPIADALGFSGFPDAVDESGFALELRAFVMKSYPQLQLDGLVQPPVNNVAVGVRYAFDSRNSLGLELGQETFYQQYKLTEGRDTYLVDQNWLGLWVGVSYQHSFKPVQFLGNTAPFLKVTAAVTEIGPLPRATIGAEYPFLERLSFRLGLEGAVLFYSQEKTIYSTSKIGGTAGALIRF